MQRSIIPFSLIFGGVCAIEFSVNKRVGDMYGMYPGIAASAVTGASFLTAADHIMFRIENAKKDTGKQLGALNAIKAICNRNILHLWAGFSPMIAREAIFITSVIYLGPLVGNQLRNLSNSLYDDKIYWSSIGRVITGVTTTLISHPFDVLARKLQIERLENPTARPTFAACFVKLRQEKKKIHHLDHLC